MQNGTTGGSTAIATDAPPVPQVDTSSTEQAPRPTRMAIVSTRISATELAATLLQLGLGPNDIVRRRRPLPFFDPGVLFCVASNGRPVDPAWPHLEIHLVVPRGRGSYTKLQQRVTKVAAAITLMCARYHGDRRTVSVSAHAVDLGIVARIAPLAPAAPRKIQAVVNPAAVEHFRLSHDFPYAVRPARRPVSWASRTRVSA